MGQEDGRKVRKLTLDQAAEELGIKRGSVYKRTQRHTLPYTIEPDGLMYVYLDNNGNSVETTNTGNSNGGDQNKQRSWWDYVAGVSGLAVLLGGLIYTLGLFALWAPIARTNTHDLVTAWHATSLAPRTVVAGLGVRQLVAFPLFMGLLILIVILLVGRLPRFSRTQSESADETGRASPDTIEDNAPVGLAYLSSTNIEKNLPERLTFALYVLILLYSAWHVTVSPGPLYEAPFLLTLYLMLMGVGSFYCIGTSVYKLVTHEYASAVGVVRWCNLRRDDRLLGLEGHAQVEHGRRGHNHHCGCCCRRSNCLLRSHGRS
jgi:hypothetical protein